MLKDFIRKIKNKNIHIVGVTGAEGSNILRFLVKHSVGNITAHDLLLEDSIEKSFKLWHKGLSVFERDKLFKQFRLDLSKVNFCSRKNYLADILSADTIFVPQSWRLYRKQNQLLWRAKEKNIPFYSLTRVYLDLAPAKVVAVTGTVGKGSVSNILVELLKTGGMNVFFAGNETWRLQVADKLGEMKKDDILVLEISHRQLQDGFSRAPHIVIFTNLYPNHLDEISFKDYKNLKFSLLMVQTPNDISILNYDILELRNIANILKSKVLYFSAENKNMNIKSIQNIYETIMNSKSVHYPPNMLAASTVASYLGVGINHIRESLSRTSPLPGRLEFIGEKSGVKFFNDIKATTPWATLAALSKLEKNTILIIGGRTKGIDYEDFANKLGKKAKFIYFLKSELSDQIHKMLNKSLHKIVDNFAQAVKLAYERAERGDNIVVSPAAGFFYSDFIKGKKSFRKLFQELRVDCHAELGSASHGILK